MQSKESILAQEKKIYELRLKLTKHYEMHKWWKKHMASNIPKLRNLEYQMTRINDEINQEKKKLADMVKIIV
jgi:hypothetical protein